MGGCHTTANTGSLWGSPGCNGLNFLCEGYQSFFRHVNGPKRLMAALLRQGRYADAVMQLFARAACNDPCPCASGRKAKHCRQP